MNAIRTCATTLLVTLAWALNAQAQLPPALLLEASVETNGASVYFPSTVSGKVVVQGCPECREQSLQLAPTTGYFINGRRVTLVQITNAARGGADKSLTIHYGLKDKIVSRIDLTVS
jgi:hypothetical protein